MYPSYFSLSGVWSAESEWIRKSTRTMKVVVKVASRNTRTEQLKSPYPTPPHLPNRLLFLSRQRKNSLFLSMTQHVCVCVCVCYRIQQKGGGGNGLSEPKPGRRRTFSSISPLPPIRHSDISSVRPKKVNNGL